MSELEFLKINLINILDSIDDIKTSISDSSYLTISKRLQNVYTGLDIIPDMAKRNVELIDSLSYLMASETRLRSELKKEKEKYSDYCGHCCKYILKRNLKRHLKSKIHYKNIEFYYRQVYSDVIDQLIHGNYA